MVGKIVSIEMIVDATSILKLMENGGILQYECTFSII